MKIRSPKLSFRKREAGASILEALVGLGVAGVGVAALLTMIPDQMRAMASVEKANERLDLRRYIKDNVSCNGTANQPACSASLAYVDLVDSAGNHFLGPNITRADMRVRAVCGTSLGTDQLRIETKSAKGDDDWKDLFDGIPVVCGTPPVSGDCPYMDQESGVTWPDMAFDLGLTQTQIYLPGSKFKCNGKCCVPGQWKPGKHLVAPPWSPKVVDWPGVSNGWSGNDYHYSFKHNPMPRKCSSVGVYHVRIRDANSASCGIEVSVLHGARGGNGCLAHDTKVLMADMKYRGIASIREGDLVWNPLLKKAVVVRRVVDGEEKKPMFTVRTGMGAIRATEEHPFLTKRGLVKTSELLPGDELVNGTKVYEVEREQGSVNYVFNLEIDGGAAPEEHMFVADGVVTGDLYLQTRLSEASKKLSALVSPIN